MIVLFDQNKNFIGYSEQDIPYPNLLSIKLLEEYADLTKWKWMGNMDEGGMVPIDAPDNFLEKIKENELIAEQINSKYPIGTQLFLIIKQLHKIAVESPQLGDDSFMDMAEFLLPLIDKSYKTIK